MLKRGMTLGQAMNVVNNYKLETKTEAHNYLAIKLQWYNATRAIPFKDMNELLEREEKELARLKALVIPPEHPESLEVLKDLIEGTEEFVKKIKKCKKLLAK